MTPRIMALIRLSLTMALKPKVMKNWIILDSQKEPKCIVKTVRVEFYRFDKVPKELIGLDRFEARKVIVKILKEKKLLEKDGFLSLYKGKIPTISGCDGYSLPEIYDRKGYQKTKD